MFEFADLINSFGIDVCYQLKKMVTKHGETIKDWSDPVLVHEPLLPFDQSQTPTNSGQGNRLILDEGGTAASIDWAWYSKHQVPIGTLITWHEKHAEVVAINDFSGYSDVYVYYLKGRSEG